MIVQAFSGEVEVTSNLSVNTNTLHVNAQTSNVGIGKINPSYNLDVNGTLNASNVYLNGSEVSNTNTVWTANGYNLYYTSGNVGIGTSSPAQKLHVNGTLEIDLATMLATTTPSLAITSNLLSVTGYTASSFTGQHRCFPTRILHEGFVVSANNNKYVSLNGELQTGIRAIKISESLPVVSLSNTSNDPSVFGVVDRREGRLRTGDTHGIGTHSTKELGDDRVIVNSLGEGAMWVVNTNGSLSAGDYITTSNVPGYGQKQDDDVLHNYTVAKITMDCDFNPQQQPIQRIKKDENGVNVLDSQGRLQWEDTDVTEPSYKIRYLMDNGVEIHESNATCIAAYVGCTFHCG